MINEQSLKDRLQTIAKEKAIPFNACWKQLLLERFLARIARSSHAHHFIFKGGFLLAYLIEIGRETADLDFLLNQVKAEKGYIQKICIEIAAFPSDDGFTFSFANIELLSQPHMNYPGYRITLEASFAKMKDKIHLDIGVGDVVAPQQLKIELLQYRGKPFFEDAISLLVYPIETIFAEKLETVLSKGSRNTRMKDYHDLFLLSKTKNLPSREKFIQSAQKTFLNRDTPISLIQFNIADIKMLQQLWTAHLNGLGDLAYQLNLPQNISVVIEEINAFISAIFPQMTRN